MPSQSLDGASLSAGQEATLRALVDAFLPPLSEPPTTTAPTRASNSRLDPKNRGATGQLKQQQQPSRRSQRAAEAHFWSHRLSSDPLFLAYIKSRLSKAQRLSLSILSTVPGTAWATGRFDGFYALSAWPVPRLPSLVQDALVSRSLGAASRLQLWHSWKRFLCGSAFMYVNERQQNPFAWEAMGYRGPRVVDRARDAQAVTKGLQEVVAGLNVASGKDDAVGQSSTGDLECDVIVVGSGAGGATAARILGEAGFDVIVMERGVSPWDPDRLLEADSSYALPSHDRTDIVLWTGGIAPSVGGSSRFGMGICQTLPPHIRQEWVDNYGLDDFSNSTDSAFELSQRAVWNEMTGFVGVADNESHLSNSPLSRFFGEACHNLSFRWKPLQSCLKDSESNGMVSLGDRYIGTKRSALNDLVGAPNVRILTSARAEKVFTSGKRLSFLPKAAGVKYKKVPTGERCVVRARRCVVVAAGALETPCLLTRSGFTNPHIGEHLRLHPSAIVFGFKPNSDSRVFNGVPASIVCAARASAQNEALIHTLTPHPGLMAMMMPWSAPDKFKARMLQLENMVPIMCMRRDSSEGSVRQTRDGKGVCVDYKINESDMLGIRAAARLAVFLEASGGASDILSGHLPDDGSLLYPRDIASLMEYFDSIDKAQVNQKESNILSMHQMGSCRMARRPRHGAVDPNGQAWDCAGLYVMDSSVFPTAIGVHPMVVIMAMARMLSLRLVHTLREQTENPRLSPDRLRYAIGMRTKAFVMGLFRILAILLVLVPSVIFWWFDLGCVLA